MNEQIPLPRIPKFTDPHERIRELEGRLALQRMRTDLQRAYIRQLETKLYGKPQTELHMPEL